MPNLRSQRVVLILPVYNEGESIFDLLKSINSIAINSTNIQFCAVVVNDCSRDDSSEWIQRSTQQNAADIHVINHDNNKGLDGALASGIQYAASFITDQDFVIFMDGDNTHDPRQITSMIEETHRGSDIVIASRFRRNAEITGLPFIRRVLSWAARFVFSLIWGIKGVRDYTCGYRLIKGNVLLAAHRDFGSKLIEQKGFCSTAELLLKFSHYARKVTEIPISLHYERKKMPSNMKIGHTIWRNLLMLLLLGSLTPNRRSTKILLVLAFGLALAGGSLSFFAPINFRNWTDIFDVAGSIVQIGRWNNLFIGYPYFAYLLHCLSQLFLNGVPLLFQKQAVNAFSAAISIFLCFFAAKRYSKNSGLAIFSSFILATSFYWVKELRNPTVDIPLSLMIFSSWCIMAKVTESRESVNFSATLLFGILTGLCVSTKFNGGIIGVYAAGTVVFFNKEHLILRFLKVGIMTITSLAVLL